MNKLYPIGAVCNLIDDIDPDIITTCTVKYIEKDDEINEIYYYYLIANDDSLNIIEDPQFPWKYFAIVSNSNPKLYRIL